MHFGCVVVHAVCDTWVYFVRRTTPLLSYSKASLVSLKSSFKKSQSYIFKNMGPQSGTTFIGLLSVMYLGTHASPFTLSWAKKIYDFKFCPLLCFCSFFFSSSTSDPQGILEMLWTKSFIWKMNTQKAGKWIQHHPDDGRTTCRVVSLMIQPRDLCPMPSLFCSAVTGAEGRKKM